MTNESTKTTDTERRSALVLIQGGRTDDAPRAEVLSDLPQSERDLNAFMAIASAVAIEEAKLMPTTPALRERAAAIGNDARAALDALDAAESQKGDDDAR